MRKEYIDGPFGQIHCRSWGQSAATCPPLICLPPSPYSGVCYMTLAPLLAAKRKVIALDYPGYGGSDDCSHPAGIADYASCAHAVAAAMNPDQTVDLLGFHSGCLVAVETALRYPAAVNRLILIDVPYFLPAVRADLMKKMAVATPLQADLTMLTPAWEFSVTKRLQHVPLPRAYEIFIDQASTGEGMNAAFGAAFSYECEKTFIKMSKPTILIATQSTLQEPTREAAAVIPGALLVELPEVTAAVLEAGAPRIAETVGAILGDC